MDIKEAFGLEKTVKFENCEWNGLPFWFEAKENMLTPRLMQQLSDIEKQPDEIARAISEVVTDWDLTSGDEEFSPTFDNLSRSPLAFLTYIIEKLSEVMVGNARTPSGSQNGSARSAKSATRRPTTTK